MEDQYAVLLTVISLGMGTFFGYLISKKSAQEILEKFIKIKILSGEIDESANLRIKKGEPVKSVGTELHLIYNIHGSSKKSPI